MQTPSTHHLDLVLRARATPLAPVIQNALQRVLGVYTREEPKLTARDAFEAGGRIRDLVYLVETVRIPERDALAAIAKVEAFILD